MNRIEKDSDYLQYKRGYELRGEYTPEEIKFILSPHFYNTLAFRYINQLNIRMDEYEPENIYLLFMLPKWIWVRIFQFYQRVTRLESSFILQLLLMK